MQGQTRQLQRGASTRTLISAEGTTLSQVSKLQLSEVPTSGASRAAVVSTSRFDGFDCTSVSQASGGGVRDSILLSKHGSGHSLSLSNAYFATMNFADDAFRLPLCNERDDSVEAWASAVSPYDFIAHSDTQPHHRTLPAYADSYRERAETGID